MKNTRIAAASTSGSLLAGCLLVALAASAAQSPAGEGESSRSVFRKDNLVAWCIVPFDAAQRGPKARAEMLKRLGLTKVAYDWRQEHVRSFEEEILAYKEHGLEYFAFWSWHADMAPLVRKHRIRPQIWKTNPSPKGGTQAQKVEAAGKQLLPLAEQAQTLGCKLGLYNHGGWGGEPENLAAVCRWLRSAVGADHVGIVYNFHHGHGHIADFAESLQAMKPHLLCLNLNGMNDEADPKILPLGQGQHEKGMMEIIAESGYAGPIGILDHRGDTDAEKSLQENLDGLKKLLGQLGDDEALRTYR
ncbi:MAG: sugar phosphate isomerase/epimerase family protein [Planctomycetota bacterium]|jgi:sugar phosphate isomerase/epimerase